MNNIIADSTNEMYRWFDILNEKYFNNSLSRPVITIQKTRKNNLGHFTLDKVWTDIENEEGMFYEINIASQSLNRDINEIVGTLLHECVHFWNRVNDIKDCSGNIHNKKFKKKAEEVGLIVTKGKSVGWGYTTNSDELNEFITNTIKPNKEVFQYYCSFPMKQKVANKTSFKYVCRGCGMKVRAKSGCSIMCGACQLELNMEE